MLTTEQLDTLVTAIDAAAEERGWNEGHQLIRVTADGDDVLVGFKDIDGHPLDALTGFRAPADWLAIGVCCEGWAAPIGTGERPSQSKGRQRVRNTVIVTRGGQVSSGVRRAGFDLELMGEGTGSVLDALREAVGLPTMACN